MTFKLNVTRPQRTEGKKSDVDWDALNKHVIDVAGTQNRSRSIPGVISGIYDLGDQEREDFEEEWNGTPDQEATLIARDPSIYFKNEKGKRWKCKPLKPCQAIAIAIDFPQVVVDKGQFFGDSSPAPLRMLLNGEFFTNGERVVARGYPLSESKHEGSNRWAFSKNSTIHKLAAAAELLDEDKLFVKERIGELIGAICQFEFQVYMKPGKDGKSYFTEVIKPAGIVPEGVNKPHLDDKYLHLVNVRGENDPEAVRQMRVSIKNTIRRANNYEGSDIQKLLEAQREERTESKPDVATAKPARAPAKRATKPSVDEMLDDDLPF